MEGEAAPSRIISYTICKTTRPGAHVPGPAQKINFARGLGYEYTCNKRAAFAWLELNDIRKGLGLPPVPLTGFIPNVAEPRRQKYRSE